MQWFPGAVVGWNMAGAFALAASLCIDERAVGEFLPVIEGVMARAVTTQARGNGDGGNG
ncbi:DUF7697 family protein [Paenirhodobacter enshiensis]|uniref:DUF7697 family protein n=1 Tax=Paenirhodobacter enshiensis TaxID=1105367 RepID=UPI0014707BE5|nr:hypothetical protein [Paenirhodobacter enshiensis]